MFLKRLYGRCQEWVLALPSCRFPEEMGERGVWKLIASFGTGGCIVFQIRKGWFVCVGSGSFQIFDGQTSLQQ